MVYEQVDCIGTIRAYIDDIEIKGVFRRTSPIPNPITEKAEIEYSIIIGDKGQEIIDNAIYSREPHTYKVNIGDALIWEYIGEIIGYNLDTGQLLAGTVDIKVCGDIKYTRKSENGYLEINK